MRRILTAAAAVLLFALFGHSSAWAFGMGFYLSLADKSSDWRANGVTRPSAMDHTDIGLTLDTNLAADRLFNYRFELGRAKADIKPFFDTVPPEKFEVDGYVMNHDFGFGVRITPALRFWFGPELRFTWMDGTSANDPSVDLDLAGWGVGAAAGLNINFPGPVTIGVKGGYVVMNYRGTGAYSTAVPGIYADRHYNVDEDLTYLTVMLMFRTGRDR